jgi:hypothetical protein
VLLLALFAAGASAVKAQQQVASSRIVLATVTDTGNRPLVELGPDDFVVEEGARQRDVLSLHMADYPMAMLLDDTPAAAGEADAIRSAALRFISKIGERAIAVGTLADPNHLLVPFDSDRAAALEGVRRFRPGGAIALPLQAAANIANAVLNTGSPFAAIVIVSGSSVPVPAAADREFLTPILRSGASVYVVANRADGAAAPDQPGDDVLRALAEQTRGQYTAIYSSASYAIALDRLADRFATEMMIEYLVPGAEPSGDVRVGVKIPGARATGLGVSK